MQTPDRSKENTRCETRSARQTGGARSVRLGLQILGSLLLLTVAGRASAETRTLSLQEAIHLAHAKNGDLQIAAAEVDAAKARVGGASLLLQANPVVMVSAGPRSSVAGTSLDFGVQVLQPIEIGGQRGARVNAAESGLKSTQAQLAATLARVTARVSSQFGRTLAMAERVQLAEEALGIAREGKSAAEERFKAGAAPLLEVNTARVELGRATRDRAEAGRALQQSRAELRFLVGLDPADEIVTTGALTTTGSVPVGTPASLVQRALAARAELRDSRAGLEAAIAEERLASREWIPTPSIGASYNREEESRASIIQGIVSIALPIFNRNPGPRGVAAARVRQARTALQVTERQITEEVLTSLTRLRAAREAVDGYAGDVVKAMQENMDLVTDSYRAGKIDFSQLVVIRRQAVDARNEYIDVLEEFNAAQAEVDLALGGIESGPRE